MLTTPLKLLCLSGQRSVYQAHPPWSCYAYQINEVCTKPIPREVAMSIQFVSDPDANPDANGRYKLQIEWEIQASN